MSKKSLSILFLAVAVAAVLVLSYFINGYRDTEFYLLGEGEGQYTQRELFFFPDAQTGEGLYVASTGQLVRAERLNWEAAFAEGKESVSYYLYEGRIFPVAEESANFYGGNTAERFVALKNGKKYLVDVSEDHTRPLFEGSTLVDPYGEGVDGISADGSWCGGIREGVLSLWKLQKGSFSPQEKKEISLSGQGYQDPVFLRFVNEVHLWFEAEKNGLRGGFLLDCDTGEVLTLPSLPEGFSSERYGRVWHLSPVKNPEGKAWEQEMVHAVSGVRKKVAVSAQEFSSLEILSVSPNGTYAAVKLQREGTELFGVYAPEDSKLTLLDESAQRLEFASDQVLFLQKNEGYRVIRIVH